MHGAPVLNTGYPSSVGGVNSSRGSGGIGSGAGLGVGARVPSSSAVDNFVSTAMDDMHHREDDTHNHLNRHSHSHSQSTSYDPMGKRYDDDEGAAPPAIATTEIRFGYGSQWRK